MTGSESNPLLLPTTKREPRSRVDHSAEDDHVYRTFSSAYTVYCSDTATVERKRRADCDTRHRFRASSNCGAESRSSLPVARLEQRESGVKRSGGRHYVRLTVSFEKHLFSEVSLTILVLALQLESRGTQQDTSPAAAALWSINLPTSAAKSSAQTAFFFSRLTPSGKSHEHQKFQGLLPVSLLSYE